MKETQKAKIRKNNIKLFPIYQMLGGDLMFFYAIKIIYLLQVKNFTASEAVLLESYYAFFAIILCIPLTMIISKIGKKNGMIIGNIFNMIYILMLIFCDFYIEFIIAEFFSATAFSFKTITEPAFLSESIPNVRKKAEINTKISGKSYARLSYFSALSTFASGFLYDANPYLPFVCATICIAMSIVVSANFIETEKLLKTEEKTKSNMKDIYLELKSGLKFIFKSKRLRGLLLMIGVCWGLLCLATSYKTTLLENIGCSASFIGGFAAVLELLRGYFSKNANKFNRKYKNKSLTIIGLTITVGLIVSGLVCIIDIPFETQLLIIMVAFSLMYARKGEYQVLKGRYLNNFTTPSILTKIYSVNGIIENVSRMIITFIGSMILTRYGYKMVISYCWSNIHSFGISYFNIYENQSRPKARRIRC